MGHVPTPPELVAFMVGLCSPPGRACSVLEPACADAPFLREFRRRYGASHRFVGVELDERWKSSAPEWMEWVHGDFIFWTPDWLYDVVLMNPPYGIVGDSPKYRFDYCLGSKEQYRRVCFTWYGKYNLYGAFLERAVSALRPGGELVAVVPASWLVLDDFRYLREYLVLQGFLDIYYVGRVFPKVNVLSVVVHLRKSSSRRLRLYDVSDGLWRGDPSSWVPSTEILTPVRPSMIRFDERAAQSFESVGWSVSGCFDVRFAARSSEYRRLDFVSDYPRSPEDVNVLSGRNLKRGRIDYKRATTRFWMNRADAVKVREFYGFPHLVVGHTKGTQIVAAIDWECYPWVEEYHLIPKRGVTVDLQRVCDWLNSDDVQNYLLRTYRNIVPHLTRTMLSRVPIPHTLCSKSVLPVD